MSEHAIDNENTSEPTLDATKRASRTLFDRVSVFQAEAGDPVSGDSRSSSSFNNSSGRT